MAKVHGRHTYISLDGKDISQYCTSSELTRGADSHDTTTYGDDDHEVDGGLRKGNASIEGIYDNTLTTGPSAAIDPIVGTKVTLIRRAEGTGTGKPEQTTTVLVEEYVETNPVADMVKWSVKLTVSGPITKTTQV
jgi:hypothetical protein